MDLTVWLPGLLLLGLAILALMAAFVWACDRV
jgi:hypothetical protein